MPYLHSFGPDDIFQNRMVTRPKFDFVMFSGNAYLNNEGNVLGQNILTGNVNLYEYNVDREAGQLIYPFVSRNTGLVFRTNALTQEQYGSLDPSIQEITGSYVLTASISRHLYTATTYPFPDGTEAAKSAYVTSRKELLALQNTLNYYKYLSNSYAYTGSYVSGTVNMLQIPSSMYGQQIKKGTVSLKFYYTGSLIDEVTDSRQNGELISTMGGASGQIVGTVLYNEGFILLTSSVNISSTALDLDDYAGNASAGNPLLRPSWQYFGAYDKTATGATGFATASLFSVSFEGTQKIPTMTMFANARSGDLNNSLNPTWLAKTAGVWRNSSSVSELGYVEPSQVEIKNTIQSQYCNYEDEFQKQTYITEIGIFDKDKNLIGIAKLANPVQKKEADNYTFKLKLDM
jgi:hypothetical protein